MTASTKNIIFNHCLVVLNRYFPITHRPKKLEMVSNGHHKGHTDVDCNPVAGLSLSGSLFTTADKHLSLADVMYLNLSIKMINKWSI